MNIGVPDASFHGCFKVRPVARGRHPSPTPAEGNPVAIAAASIKLPPFWPADPHIWFAQVEAQFATRKIKISVQKTMYEYVVASLTPEFATEVRDLILTIRMWDMSNCSNMASARS